jgi:hypothetical protein
MTLAIAPIRIGFNTTEDSLERAQVCFTEPNKTACSAENKDRYPIDDSGKGRSNRRITHQPLKGIAQKPPR